MKLQYLIFTLAMINQNQGGTLNIDNLKPICARCNLSMSNNLQLRNGTS